MRTCISIQTLPKYATASDQPGLVLNMQTKKNWDMARQCYEKAATGQERQGSSWHAGKMMEKAAEACKETPGSQVVSWTASCSVYVQPVDLGH